MEPMKPKKRARPEDKIRDRLKKFLELRGWFVVIMHGSMYQSGIPDLYATHKDYGPRWIEVKLPHMEGSKFTVAQVAKFPKLSENGSPIWILTGSSEQEYRKLFEPENWFTYMMLKL